MRSDAIDQLLSDYFKLPALVSWDGAMGDSVRGIFEGARLELTGLAVMALPFDRLVLEADRFQFIPGLPARFESTGPRIELSIDQRQIDSWLARTGAPFELKLGPDSIGLRLDVAGFPVSRADMTLAVERGWFVLKPVRAEFMGLRNRLASLFRTYLPLPRLAPQTRLAGIQHRPGALCLELALDDFADEITPGLVLRMQKRFLPFSDSGAWIGSWRGQRTR